MSLLDTLQPRLIKPKGARRICRDGEPTPEQLADEELQARRLYFQNYHHRKKSDPAYMERRRKAAIKFKRRVA